LFHDRHLHQPVDHHWRLGQLSREVAFLLNV
jgi:hypothetical protein